MKVSTFKQKSIAGKLPIALCYLFASVVFAQNAKEIEAIKKSTDVRALGQFRKSVEKSTLSEKKLQEKAKKMGIPFEGEFEGQYYKLQGFSRKKGFPLYYVTYNTDASEGTGVDKLNASGGIFNLDGEGITVHEWDGGGVNIDHKEYLGRVLQKDSSLRVSDHSTHVAGTLVASGRNANAKGMAPKARLDAYEWTHDTTEMTRAAANGALVSNHSYGFQGGFVFSDLSGKRGWHWLGSDDATEYYAYGLYESTDALWDFISSKAPYYLAVKAAGNPRGMGPKPGGLHYVRVTENDEEVWKESTKVRQINGGELGYDCINQGSTNKNAMIVGAANKIPGGYHQPSDVRIASFSAFGPTDDGRIKPDITGIGVDVFSTSSSNNTAYTTKSGTSMASPNVTGALVLLQQHYKKLGYGTDEHPFMKSATLKALAIHTANEAGDYPGPDYKHGWGLMNAFKAAQTLSVKDKYSLIREEKIDNKGTYTLELTAKGNEPLVVTIVWDDPAPEDLPNPNNEINNRTRALVNDLDIKISDGTNTFLPWKLDPVHPQNGATKGDNTVDNVEQIVIDNPVAGKTYTVTVSHKGDLKKNDLRMANRKNKIILVPADSQAFSLVATGINNGVNKDLSVTSITLPPVKLFSSSSPVNIIVENIGKEKISKATVKYSLINMDEDNRVESTGTVSLSDIAAGGKKEAFVNIDLSKSFTNYTVLAEVSSDEDTIESNNKYSVKAYGVISDLTAENTKHDFGFEDNFSKNGWTAQDADKDESTWRKYDKAELAKSGSSIAVNFSVNKKGTDDWLFSNPLRLKANAKYRVVFSTKRIKAHPESLKLFFGKEADSASMTTMIGKEVKAEDDYVRHIFEFSPTEDGLYHIGFHNKSDKRSYAVLLDDVSVQYALSKPVVDFSVSNKNPDSYEIVDLKSDIITDSTLPVTSYKWEFSPNDVTFKDGTSAISADSKVVFNKRGDYDITLKAVNDKGEGVLVRKEFIYVSNEGVDAKFTPNKEKIFRGDKIIFTDRSTGKPKPNKWEWTITPSENVEFVDGTTNASQNPVVKFNQVGDYKITLTATSPHSSDTYRRRDLIKVMTPYNEVENLTGTVDTNKKITKLQWRRPKMLSLYLENFDTGKIPSDITLIDEDKDGENWRIINNPVRGNIRGSLVHSGKYAALSYSTDFEFKGRNTDNWMVTSKIPKGGELLRFWKFSTHEERLDIYIVPAPASGALPTLDQIKAGTKIYDAKERSPRHREVVVDITKYTGTDNYIAFHHKSRAEDEGLSLILDDIEIGFNNYTGEDDFSKSSDHVSESTENNAQAEILPNAEEEIQKLRKSNSESKEAVSHDNTYVETGINDFPRLIGYEVKEGDRVLQTIDDISKTFYQESSEGKTGMHTYSVYAKYSDNERSEEKIVTIDFDNLATAETNLEDLKIYPNPSDGRFTVEAGNHITSLKTEVYDMSGKLIFTQNYKGHRADINLTNHPKGVYVLYLTNNKGERKAVKLMIK